MQTHGESGSFCHSTGYQTGLNQNWPDRHNSLAAAGEPDEHGLIFALGLNIRENKLQTCIIPYLWSQLWTCGTWITHNNKENINIAGKAAAEQRY